MLDLGSGPFLVAVADEPAAIAACAALEPDGRRIDLVEARIDLFPGQRIDACAESCARLEATGTPVLATLRSATQGGRFAGGDAERLLRLRAALAVASWIDVEDDAGRLVDTVAELVALRPGGQLVVSHHDFGSTPSEAELVACLDACHAASPGAVAKLATTVRREDDRAALRAALRARPNRTCVLGMGDGEDGFRVELAAAGSLLAYGYLAGPTAPGQLSAAALHQRLLVASPRYAARHGRAGD